MMNYGAAELMASVAMSGEETGAEFDANLEPFSRGRANTWHAGLLYPNEVSIGVPFVTVMIHIRPVHWPGVRSWA